MLYKYAGYSVVLCGVVLCHVCVRDSKHTLAH